MAGFSLFRLFPNRMKASLCSTGSLPRAISIAFSILFYFIFGFLFCLDFTRRVQGFIVPTRQLESQLASPSTEVSSPGFVHQKCTFKCSEAISSLNYRLLSPSNYASGISHPASSASTGASAINHQYPLVTLQAHTPIPQRKLPSPPFPSNLPPHPTTQFSSY